MAATSEAVAECPSCGSRVPMEATECPRCGELFAEDALEVDAPAEPKGRMSVGFREKILFYMGVVLILLGGPGIALGSWLHDVLQISYGEYTNFDVFGPVNRLVAAVGLVVLIVGIVFLILSLRLSRPADPEYDLGTPRGS